MLKKESYKKAKRMGGAEGLLLSVFIWNKNRYN
jgi:hypothetical protein